MAKAPSEKMLSVFMVKMPAAMREQVSQLAEKEGCSGSAIIRRAIEQFASSRKPARKG